MPTSAFIRVIGVATAAASLVACSSGVVPQSSPVASAGSTQAHAITSATAVALSTPGATAPYVYVSDVWANFIDEFDVASGALVAKMTTGPTNPGPLFVDSQHNLWVGMLNGSGIMMFPHGTSTAARRLQDGGLPQGIAVGKDGTVYVSNALDQGGRAGSILIYPPGQNRPQRSLRDPQAFENYYVTVDDNGDVFVTANLRKLTQYVGRVDEYVNGTQAGLRRWPVRLYAPGGIKWLNGKVYVCDNGEYTVAEYTYSGLPTGRKLVTGGAWYGIDVSADGKTIVGADDTNLQGITRAFPWGKIGETFADPAFVFPTDVAFSDQKGF